MLEKEIEKKVCDHAKTNKILTYKFQSPSNKGVPDRMFITPKGKVFFIEFKSKNKKTTKLQNIKILEMQKNNVDVFVIDNTVSGFKTINQMIYA